MSSLLSYKNYNGTVEYSKDDECLFGKVVGIKSLLSYEGNSIQEFKCSRCGSNRHDAVRVTAVDMVNR
jgi:predicted HicB family RNase H-like nuclease